jgi:pyruvate-formate lyase-activating enzyme
MGDTMRYSGIIRNDLAAAPGVSVSFFTQGCPHRCKGCHNPETWDFEGGKEFTPKVLEEIYEALGANNINRSFCIMGGAGVLAYIIAWLVMPERPEDGGFDNNYNNYNNGGNI